MSEATDFDVIIAGAGPVGLSLALALARKKLKILVLEKNNALSEHSRAPAIWPKTQEIFNDIGVLERLTKAGIVLDKIEIWDSDHNKSLIQFSFDELKYDTSFPQFLILPQSKTEALLYKELTENYPVAVKFSSPLVGFQQNDSSVTVRFSDGHRPGELTTKYLVGCDGAHSKVRELLGLHLDGFTYPVKAALADIEVPESEAPTKFPLLSTKDVLVIGIKIEKNLWRLILPFTNSDSLPLDERISQARNQLFGEKDYKCIWKSEFKLHRRISKRFVNGRVILAGDAAHLNSPVGGQGMNAGIQDTAVLAEALNQTLQTDDTQPLKKYEKMRREKIKGGVNQFTNILTRILLTGDGKAIRAIFSLADKIFKIGYLRRQFLLRLTMLR